MADTMKSGAYERLLMHHKSAYSCIASALEKEEELDLTIDHASREEVINTYKRGFDQLKRGLAISVVDVPESKMDRIKDLQAKMQRNLTHVEERLNELGSPKYLSSQPRSRPSTSQLPDRRPFSAASNANNGNRRQANKHVDVKKTSHKSLSPRPSNGRMPRASKATTMALPAPAKVSKSRSGSFTKGEIRNKINSLKGVDSRLAHSILDHVLETESTVTFDDVIGLVTAKRALHEAVILPALNPGVFTGLRSPAKGILLFGPPGNGKTLLAKAVANEGKCTFFNISASALTSKWVGEAEKLVKALFAMAQQLQPAIIFIDEIDSILCIRSEKDNEVSRRLKTEFLLQFDGVGSKAEDRVLVMGATNRPFELDDAVIRRFPKRIYIPLPDADSRQHLLTTLLKRNDSSQSISPTNLRRIASATDGYSNSDLANLAAEAAMGPVREVSSEELLKLRPEQLRSLTVQDFLTAMSTIRPSTNMDHMKKLEDFAKKYGELIKIRPSTYAVSRAREIS